uniref:PPPDE domain-containing protein n=1 Tax=Aureoumbra lagunensis TaxID=44058 RepID=A0A7S3NPU6_9STRA|mmetsp:Transcript_4047/g.5681  ORF Transcript_4047/g.5681 Transcript_4047/m.5681 type:complete len:239 (-) Transcript_4047:202-918(-)
MNTKGDELSTPSKGELSPSRESHLVVTLNIYDFIKHESMSGSVMAFLGFGIHHSGLQIEDTEYTFNNSGIIRMQRLRMPFCRLNDSINLGKFWGTNQELENILSELESEFSPGSYNVLHKNCNHFVDALSTRLIGISIPNWVNRSANVACMMGLTTKTVRRNMSSTSLSSTTISFSHSPSRTAPSSLSVSKPKPHSRVSSGTHRQENIRKSSPSMSRGGDDTDHHSNHSSSSNSLFNF